MLSTPSIEKIVAVECSVSGTPYSPPPPPVGVGVGGSHSEYEIRLNRMG